MPHPTQIDLCHRQGGPYHSKGSGRKRLAPNEDRNKGKGTIPILNPVFTGEKRVYELGGNRELPTQKGEFIMKTVSILGAVLAVFLLAFHSSASDSPPPFPEASKPGLYVNKKIGFALPYPGDFAPVQPQGREIFRAEPKNRYPSLRVWFMPNLKMPLKNCNMIYITQKIQVFSLIY